MKIVYPGTFDPFSLGHLDLVQRAAKIFPGVIIAVSESDRKKPVFSLDERVEMAKMAVKDIPGAEVKGFSNLLVDFMRENNASYTLRGIRGMVDFEYEFQMAQVNRAMLPSFESIFLMPGEKYMVLSSTIIREVYLLGGDLSDFLPTDVLEYIENKRKNDE